MNNDILPFWQEIGTSTSIIAKRVSEKLGAPTSHTGTLDPMASGVVLILKGDEYFNKEKYIQKNKTYEFSILFGFDTDTHDGLGLITKTIEDEKGLLEKEVAEVIDSFKGLYHQKYPEFSSKKISGKSLWEYKRQGLKVPEVYIDGEISDIQLLNFKEVLSSEQIELIKKQIESIKGNFRQEEILARYDATKFPHTLFKAKISVTMSRGMYVRGLVRDISHKLKTFGIVVDLVRTKDGEYSKENCYLLNDYFSEELKSNPHFFEPEYKNF